MKRILSLPILLLLAGSIASAQTIQDQKFQTLLQTVLTLRNADKDTYEHLQRQMEEARWWTPMNETGGVQAEECQPSEKVPGFRLNRLLNPASMNRKAITTHGDMLNGEDERYNYSLYERSVHAGKTVAYPLTGREGRQWFVVVPYEADGGGISATLSVDGGEAHPFTPQTSAGHSILVLYLDTPELTKEQTLQLSVTGGTRPQSFVLLNHNTRQ